MKWSQTEWHFHAYVKEKGHKLNVRLIIVERNTFMKETGGLDSIHFSLVYLINRLINAIFFY